MNNFKYSIVLRTIIAIALLSFTNLFAQESPDTLWNVVFDSLEVKASRLPTTQFASPRSVSLINASSQNSGNQGKSLQDLLIGVPGLTAMNSSNFAQDLRVSIRGFGSRAAFGIRGIKILYDGVPATTPDGQSQIDHVALFDLDRIEILRASSGGLYGNASGGVIDIRSSVPAGDQASLGVGLGSDGLLQTRFKLDQINDRDKFGLAAGYTTYQGYRDHSGTRSLRLKANYQRDFDKGYFRIISQYTDSPKADDPGALVLDQVDEDRSQARDRNLLFNAGENVKHFVGAVDFNKQWNASGLKIQTFYQRRNFVGRLPFEAGGLVEFGRDFYGTTLQYQMESVGVEWLAGVDIEKQIDNRERFQNQEGLKGPTTLDQREVFSSQGFYLLGKSRLSAKFNVEAALRLDHLMAQVDDFFISDGLQSGERSWWHFSPSAGLNYTWFQDQFVFIQGSHSFETPSLTELTNNPSGLGGFNADLKPQIADQIELGAKGLLWSGLSYQLVVFKIFLQNELVPFELEDSPGRTFYQNSGKSQRRGLELGLDQRISQELSLRSSYTYADYTYRQFVTDGGDLEGKFIPGIPRHQFSFGLSYAPESGFYGHLEFWSFGKLFADDENTTEVVGYSILHPRLGWKSKGKMKTNLYVGIRNATGTRYYDNIRINAFGARYYEPAVRQEWFAGAIFVF